MREDSERLARLVDDLLALERAGAAPSSLELAPLELAELVRKIADGRERVILGRLEATWVRGQPESLARVLENLIDNALVHGPAKSAVRVELRATAGHASLTVSDEGPGPSDPQRVFERFWRAPEAAGRPGSGLGLSIVSAIVERHGGSVAVDGSAFTVQLPAQPQPPGSPVEPRKRSVSA